MKKVRVEEGDEVGEGEELQNLFSVTKETIFVGEMVMQGLD